MPVSDASPSPPPRLRRPRSSIPPVLQSPDSPVASPLDSDRVACSRTSLDPDEISVRFHPPSPTGTPAEQARDLHLTFRHSFWRRRRAATRDALLRQGASSAALQRFDDCGTAAWILRDPDNPDVHRLATNRCRHRWCEACAGDRRRIIVRNLQSKLPTDDLRLLTLTLKSAPGDLRPQLDRLYDSFRTFRRHRDIRDRMTGGIYFLELTYNERTACWHPHLHVLFGGFYLPHALAKQTWLDLTGDSFIVDVRRLRDRRGAASYVAKYASKSVSASVWAHPRRLDQAIAALDRRRTFQTFGTWQQLHLSRADPDGVEWEVVCTLADLITQARAGDPNARRTLTGLAANHHLEALDLSDHVPDTS